MNLDRHVIIRASSAEYMRWKKNVGNISYTVRLLMDIRCTELEAARNDSMTNKKVVNGKQIKIK